MTSPLLTFNVNLLEMQFASVLKEKAHSKLSKQGVAPAWSVQALSLNALLPNVITEYFRPTLVKAVALISTMKTSAFKLLVWF